MKPYIRRVNQEANEELQVSSVALQALDDISLTLMDRIASMAAGMCRATGKKTLSIGDVQSATKLVLPRELHEEAESEGTEALERYTNLIER